MQKSYFECELTLHFICRVEIRSGRPFITTKWYIYNYPPK